MTKEDIKVGMLVKSSLYRSILPPYVGVVGMVIDYPGGEWIYILYREKIVSWNIGFCEPLTG
jgi:hypothetical protein